MGFWEYFKNTLAWPLIKTPGHLAALAQGAAGSLDASKQDVLWLRDQFLPENCDDAHVVEFARARGIERHQLETDTQFRTRVAQAFAWQLLGGKQVGMPRILEHYGYPGAKIINLRDEDPDRWAEFRVELETPEGGLKEQDFGLLSWVANDQKPARSVLAAIRVPASDSAEVSAGGLAAVGNNIVASIRTSVALDQMPARAGGIARMGIQIGATLPSPLVAAEAMAQYATGLVRWARPITVGV